MTKGTHVIMGRLGAAPSTGCTGSASGMEGVTAGTASVMVAGITASEMVATWAATCAEHRAHFIGPQWVHAPRHGDPSTGPNLEWIEA